MSHFLVGVILPKDTEDAEQTVDELLAPYDENIAVAPYRKYIKGDDLKRMKQHYKKTRMADLVEDIKSWSGYSGGIDKDGLYYLSTYNPSSQWDWYVIGGRWNGEIVGKPRDDDKGGFNFGEEYHHLDENMCLVKEAKLDCYAFVTPDGEWLERGSMGWWGVSTDEVSKEEWNAAKEELKTKYAEHQIVGVDCHI